MILEQGVNFGKMLLLQAYHVFPEIIQNAFYPDLLLLSQVQILGQAIQDEIQVLAPAFFKKRSPLVFLVHAHAKPSC
jgi:hypothetical protein